VRIRLKGIVTLNDSNYVTWSLQARLYLQSKELYTIAITADTPAPANANYDQWLTANAKAHSLLTRTIDATHMSLYGTKDNAKLVWDALKDRYGTPNEVEKLLIMKKLTSVSMSASQSIASYLTHVKNLVEECRIAGRMVADRELVFHTLNGINRPEFQQLVNILRCDDAITFSKLERILTQNEARAQPAAELFTWGHQAQTSNTPRQSKRKTKQAENRATTCGDV
jgi:hypothetical protein